MLLPALLDPSGALARRALVVAPAPAIRISPVPEVAHSLEAFPVGAATIAPGSASAARLATAPRVAALPRTATGKLKKFELRETHWQETGAIGRRIN